MQSKLSERSAYKNSTSNSQANLLPEQVTDNVDEYIQILIEYQLSCEHNGRYVEAKQARERVAELRFEAEAQQLNDIRLRHLSEVDGIERGHLEEFNNFNSFWDRKMTEFD